MPVASRRLFGVVVMVSVALGAQAAAGQDDSTTTTTVTTQPSSTAEPTTTTAAPDASTSTSTTAADSTTSGPAAPSAVAPSPATSTTVDAAARAETLAKLNVAKAADVEIAQQLNEINKAANVTLEKIDDAQVKIDEADAVLARTEEELERSGNRQQVIEKDLRVKAIEGFKTRTLGYANPLLTDMDLNRAIRQNGLLAQASLSTAELLEELRGLLEERRLANLEAAQAKSEAETARQLLEDELSVLQEQQATQLALKAEAERRVDIWAAELTAYAKEDAAIQRVIVEKSTKEPVTTAVNNPTQPSTSGFQWPINARVTSEYGYRTHPIYRTRRLHTGMDIGAAGGTPIASANGGVVIFAGRQGGYGNTIIVDHGGGITTLYAHQSQFGSSVGQLVERGDIIGFVGRTGTATGNHLHFEVRVNGSPANPRNYLP